MTSQLEAFRARVTQVEQDPKFFRRSALSIRDGAGVFEKILGGGKYKRVLEIGTYRGITAAFMAGLVDHVTTIDLANGQLEQQGDPFDREAFWKAMGIDNITLHLVENEKKKRRLIAGLDFDFAFIDGDHAAPAPERDFNLVRRCRAVLFHDYDGDNGVTQFVPTLPRDQVTYHDIFAFWTLNG